MKSTALILVDLEKEWIDKNSEYFLGDVSQEIEKINKLIQHCRERGCKIIFTVHVEKDSPDAFAVNSENVEIIDDINHEPSDIVVYKNKISSFYNTDLENHLAGIDKIITCGFLTNLCVRSLVQDAYDRDFDITVIEDCCRAFDKETHVFTIKDLKETREEVEFLKLEEFLKSIDYTE